MEDHPEYTKEFLTPRLQVGAKIRVGKSANLWFAKEGEVLTLSEGHFEYDNGLYTEDQVAPSVWADDEWHSIYHLFGNNFENFGDCSVVASSSIFAYDALKVVETLLSDTGLSVVDAGHNLGQSVVKLVDGDGETRSETMTIHFMYKYMFERGLSSVFNDLKNSEVK